MNKTDKSNSQARPLVITTSLVLYGLLLDRTKMRVHTTLEFQHMTDFLVSSGKKKNTL